MTGAASRGGLVIAALIAVFVSLVVRTAWVCDDAYVTFRVADNFLNGYGLRWTVAERVQAFTNPLWLFVMSGLFALTWDVYYTSLVASIVLSGAAALIVVRRVAHSEAHAALALALLCFSKASSW